MTLTGAVKATLVFGLVTTLAYPITREVAARGAVQQQLLSAMDVNDTVALKEWQGSAQAFVAMLRERCERINGEGASACDRYRPIAD